MTVSLAGIVTKIQRIHSERPLSDQVSWDITELIQTLELEPEVVADAVYDGHVNIQSHGFFIVRSGHRFDLEGVSYRIVDHRDAHD